jgi:PKHD-type hydroxylase
MGFRIEKLKEASLDKWYWFNDSFTAEEFAKIEFLQASLEFRQGDIAKEEKDLLTYRKSKVKWLTQQMPEAKWIYEKLMGLVSEANDELWRFEITDIFDNIQYTVYEAGGGHYDWHMDIGCNTASRRKISITIQLSDPDEYEGGDLEFMIGKDVQKVSREKGCTIVFPSYFMHRVTPVTKGTRKSIVLWISGPPFR